MWKNKFINAVDWIVTSTENEKRDAIKFGFSEDIITNIPIGYDKDLFKATENKEYGKNDIITITFVGRISESRNPFQVILAFEELTKQFTNIQLRIVGGPVKRSSLEKGDYFEQMQE